MRVPADLGLAASLDPQSLLACLELLLADDQLDGAPEVFGRELGAGARRSELDLRDPHTRLTLLGAGRVGATVQDDWIVVDLDGVGSGLPGAAPVRASLRRLVTLAAWLGLDAPTAAERLARCATASPEPGRRALALELLVRVFPDATCAADTRRAALADPAALVQLSAALRSPAAEASPVLVALIEERDAPEVAVEALERLLHLGLYTRPQLRRWAATASTPVRCAVVERLGRAASEVELLCRLLEQPEAAVAIAAAERLRRLRVAAAAPWLVGILDHSERDRAVAAVRALAEVGGLDSVAPLKALVGRLRAPGSLGTAAARAIDRIQTRHGHERPGGLSWPAEDGGELTLSGEAAGHD